MICGKVTATTATGCTVQGMISQGTASILSRLTAAEAGREEASRWQPIETAPKDNEDSILVCDARVVGGFHQVVWWSEGPKATGYNWYTSDGPNFHRDAFTHWMPLPKEPALTEAQPKGDL